MKKILISMHLPDEIAKKYSKEFVLEYPKHANSFSPEELLAKLSDVSGYLGGPLTREMIDNAPILEIASSFGAGFDHIDHEYAGEKGVLVMNAPHATTDSTAELTIAIMLCLSRKIINFSNYMRKTGTCTGITPFVDPIEGVGIPTIMSGKILGIVGFGKIGKAVSTKAGGLGMSVIYYDTIQASQAIEKEYNIRYVPFEELLKTSDFVSLHCMYNPQNHHLMDEKQFEMMKPTAYFINAGRGKLMNEKALIKALKAKKIAGAALDVYEFEPAVTPELFEQDNVVLVPHIGTGTYESRAGIAYEALDGITVQLRGGSSPTIVNMEFYKKTK